MAEYKFSYTAAEIDEKLGKVDLNETKISQLSGEVDVLDKMIYGDGGESTVVELGQVFVQSTAINHKIPFYSGTTYIFKTSSVGASIILFKTDEYNGSDSGNLSILRNSYNEEVEITLEDNYRGVRIWCEDSATEREVASYFYVREVGVEENNESLPKSKKGLYTTIDSALNGNRLKTNASGENVHWYRYHFVKGKKYKISASKSFHDSSSLALTVAKSEETYPMDSITVFTGIDRNATYTFEALDTYDFVRLYQANADCEIELIIEEERPNIKYSNVEELEVILTNGTFDGGWLDTSGDKTTAVRTQMFLGKGLYLVSFPDELQATYTYEYNNLQDVRFNHTVNHPFSLFCENMVRVFFKRKDGLPVQVETIGDLKNQIKIWRVASTSGEYDVTIACENTRFEQKRKADIVCDGTNDTEILASIFGCIHSLKVLLYGGNYNIDKMWTHSSTAKCALTIQDKNFSFRKQNHVLTVHGLHTCLPQSGDAVNFIVSQSLHESLADSGMNYFIVGTPYSYNEEVPRSSVIVNFKNFNVIGWKYDKPITYVDTSKAMCTMLESVCVRGWYNHRFEADTFEETPHAECTGIRVGRGGCHGNDNYVKHLNVWHVNKGVVCNGEHFVLEDVKSHTNYIGFYFGDRNTYGRVEHANMMIGCSIEGCYRTMVLSKMGVTTEQDFVRDYDNKMQHSSLTVLGTGTELVWRIPLNEVVGDTTQYTLPVKEILRGCYYGTLEIDNGAVEEGSCNNMQKLFYPVG